MMMRFTVIFFLAVLGIVVPVRAQTDEKAEQAPPTFAEQVDLARFGQIAVHAEGRVKSLDSHARTLMQLVQGAPRRDDPTPTFTYLDMMFRPDAYADADIIFIKNKSVRAQIIQALRNSMQSQLEEASPERRSRMNQVIADIEPRLDAFLKSGRISPRMLDDTRVHELLGRLQSDLLRTAKVVDALETAMAVSDARNLRANLKIIAPPPPEGTFEDPWFTFDSLNASQPPLALSTLDSELRGKLISQWGALSSAWQEQNAPGVNAAADELAQLLPTINPELYPETARLAWESWYFRAHNMTWVWLIYAFTLVPLLLAVVFRWPAARIIGLLMFLTAFGFHTFAVMLRWYVADRWPNSNMFEAVTTAAWFGGCFALALELAVRRLPMRNLFALGSATASMCALMAVHFLPLQLNPSISNMMPVLHDVWLYIHTNVIILSYCLIFIAAVTAIIYLAYRFIALLADWPRAMEYSVRAWAGPARSFSRGPMALRTSMRRNRLLARSSTAQPW